MLAVAQQGWGHGSWQSFTPRRLWLKTPRAADIIAFAARGTGGPSISGAGSLRDKDLGLMEPTGWRLYLPLHRTPAGSGGGGAWVGAAAGGARGPRRGPGARPGKGLPEAGRLGGAVGRRPRGAGASASFLPPNPIPARVVGPGGSSPRSPAPPAAARAPLPAAPGPPPPPAAHLGPRRRPRPGAGPPLVGPRAPVPSPSRRPRPLSQ